MALKPELIVNVQKQDNFRRLQNIQNNDPTQDK